MASSTEVYVYLLNRLRRVRTELSYKLLLNIVLGNEVTTLATLSTLAIGILFSLLALLFYSSETPTGTLWRWRGRQGNVTSHCRKN